MVKFVVSDIDGTLIYKGSHLNTARFPLMLEKLNALGIPFAVATGRHYSEIKKLFGTYEQNITCICCNGAYAVKNGATIVANPIMPTAAKSITDSLLSKKTSLVFHSIGNSYFLGDNSLVFRKEQGRLSDLCKITDVSEIKKDIFQISAYGEIKYIPMQEDIRISYSSRGIAEYVSSAASKFNTVKTLCETGGTPLSDILFFGDGENDAELIKACGLSYTTYCADRPVFSLTKNHTRDVIGTTIRLAEQWQKLK